MPQTQEARSTLSIREWRNIIDTFALLVALTVMVFARSKIGFRRLTPGAVFGMAGLLYALNAIGNLQLRVPLAGTIGAHHQTQSLEYFGLAFLGVGLWARRKRWHELVRGELWNTYSFGVSYFEFLPIRQDLVYRIVDPLVALLGGCVIAKLGLGGLGHWIVFASMCWALVEAHVYERQRDRDCDTVDSLVEARVHAETAAHFASHENEEIAARSLKETGGIQTGVDASLEAQIAKRKREAAARRNNDGDLAGVRS